MGCNPDLRQFVDVLFLISVYNNLKLKQRSKYKILREKHRRGKIEVKVILKGADILGYILCVF